MGVVLTGAVPDDAAVIAALRAAVAERLTRDFGAGPWSATSSANSVLRDIGAPGLFVLRRNGDLVATLRLATKKPWSIDPMYFTTCAHPLYLTDMAVDPTMQRKGVGRDCLEAARNIAHAWPADAIRLDAYDAPAGAGGFYAKCGFQERGRVTYRGTPLVYYEMLT